ncbi:MAG: sialidase family protein [Gemmataceae bacterium]
MLLLLLALHADPTLTDLWEAGKGGYALYRIPAIVVTAKGTLLAACEARKHAKSDWGHIDLLIRRSDDGGKTFSAPAPVAVLDRKFDRNPAAAKQKFGVPGETTVNNPVLIARRDGTVHFLYCVEYARVFHRVSADDGKTWSKAAEVTAALEPLRKTYPWLVVGTGPGHGLEHSSGRLLVPVWLSTGTGGHAHRPSVVTTLVSDDGKTWKAGDIVAREKEPLLNPSETTAAELPDGRVLLNLRSESKQRRRAFSTSKDGLSGWTVPAFDDALLEPVCMGSLLNVGKALYFSNPHTPAGRTNLSVVRSDDGGKTWAQRRAVYEGPSAYSDLAAGPDGSLWCLFERGEGRSPYRWLTLAKLK